MYYVQAADGRASPPGMECYHVRSSMVRAKGAPNAKRCWLAVPQHNTKNQTLSTLYIQAPSNLPPAPFRLAGRST